MKTKVVLFVISFIFISVFVNAQSIVGKWKTIDDESGEAKSVVEIYKGGDGKYYGKIVKLFLKPGEDQNPKCTECDDHRKNKPIIGLIIITDLEKDGDEYEDGEILDPNNGTVYDCKMEIENGKLHVRGYVGWSLIGRTQVWLPYKGTL